jgi:hypothetical protein
MIVDGAAGSKPGLIRMTPAKSRKKQARIVIHAKIFLSRFRCFIILESLSRRIGLISCRWDRSYKKIDVLSSQKFMEVAVLEPGPKLGLQPERRVEIVYRLNPAYGRSKIEIPTRVV